MPITEGKQRASRIPLDYYKHPDPLVRWKRRLTWRSPASLVTVEPWNSNLILRSNSTRTVSFWRSPIGFLGHFGRKSLETLGFSGNKAQTPCRNDRVIWEIWVERRRG